jgi:plasmid stabilization system protein ParE
MSDKRYTVKFTPKARLDLENIYGYVGGDLQNPSAASGLADKFEKAFDRISMFPLSCPIGRTEPDYRKLVMGNYIAFYKVLDEQQTLVIYRVFYGMMDYDKYL